MYYVQIYDNHVIHVFVVTPLITTKLKNVNKYKSIKLDTIWDSLI